MKPMSKPLDAIKIFVTVVEQGSFASAGRALNMPKSTVSRHIQRLEARLQLRLLHRTTRQIRLTEAGQRYFTEGRRITEQLARLEEEMREFDAEPTGQLTISAPIGAFSDYFSALGMAFMNRYPRLSMRVILTNREVDLLAEGVDVALRASEQPLADSSMISRRLVPAARVFCVSPSYLEANGQPCTLAELSEHPMLLDEETGKGDRLTLPRHDPVDIHCRLRSDSNDLLHQAARQGLGVGLLPILTVTEDIERGTLVPILTDVNETLAWIYILYPERQFQSAKVRVFIDFLLSHLNSFPSLLLET